MSRMTGFEYIYFLKVIKPIPIVTRKVQKDDKD
jgi:hypothetical protein